MIVPMLASAAPTSLTFPLYASPKLDGIRCIIKDGVALGRSLKPIPNIYVQSLFGRNSLNGLDGELIVGEPDASDVFTKTTSGVMSIDGKPDVRFFVFDDFTKPNDGFSTRLLSLTKRKSQKILVVSQSLIGNHEELMILERDYLLMGYEGVMLRQPDGRYKFGRSTAREGLLLKLKRFTDAEAQIIGFSELQHNNNEACISATGHLERSSHKAGKSGMNTLGALRVRNLADGVEFEIGTGFSQQQRQWIWDHRAMIQGQFVKYKFQMVGMKEKPRFPVFIGLRNPVDM